jgi:hypothetical protein
MSCQPAPADWHVLAPAHRLGTALVFGFTATLAGYLMKRHGWSSSGR